MTSSILTHALPLGATASGQGAGLVERAIAALRAWRLRVRTANELARLNDRMLEDIGLTRAEVEAYVAGRTKL